MLGQSDITLAYAIKLEFVFIDTEMAQMVEPVLRVKRSSGRTVSFTSNDYLETFRALDAMITPAGTSAWRTSTLEKGKQVKIAVAMYQSQLFSLAFKNCRKSSLEISLSTILA